MQPDTSVGQLFRYRMAAAGHQNTLRVDMLVAHVEAVVGQHRRDQKAFPDGPASVFCPDELSVLLIMEPRFIAYFPIIRIGHRPEDLVVVHALKSERVAADAAKERKSEWCCRQAIKDMKTDPLLFRAVGNHSFTHSHFRSLQSGRFLLAEAVEAAEAPDNVR